MSDIQNWLLDSPKWTTKHIKLIKAAKCDEIKVSLAEILEKSKKFPIKFPIDSIRNNTLMKTVSKRVLERNVRSVYPIIHETAFYLCVEFLLFKQKHGSKIEKKFYENMSVLDLIHRLLIKKAMMFVGSRDFYMLRDGTTDLNQNWGIIGTEKQKKPLILDDYLSYDELKLAAFVSVSSYSYFINDGSRQNSGIPDDNRDNIQSEGIIVGLIGTRLPKPHVMENEDIVIYTDTSNKTDYNVPNIKNLFLKFYQDNLFLTGDVDRRADIRRDLSDMENDKNRYTVIRKGVIFDNAVYAKRLAISFDTLLLEANHRAQESGKLAYIHVVGIGMGVWKISKHQDNHFMDTFGHRIRALGSNLNFVSDIDFSYFASSNCHGYEDGSLFPIQGHPHGGIKIHISRRQPFAKLENEDLLLVVSYAWDSNAHPGNEFWDGAIHHSSDSATAASSQVSELHNPGVNPAVSASKLMLATPTGLLHVHDYLKKVLAHVDDGEHEDVDEEPEEVKSCFRWS